MGPAIDEEKYSRCRNDKKFHENIIHEILFREEEMRKGGIFIMVIFFWGVILAALEVSTAPVVQKKPLPLPLPQPNQATFISFTPSSVRLKQGEGATVVVEGSYLESVLSAGIAKDGRLVPDITVKLVQPWPGSKRIELRATAAAPAAQGYQLRFIGRAGIREFRVDVPLSMFSLDVAMQPVNLKPTLVTHPHPRIQATQRKFILPPDLMVQEIPREAAELYAKIMAGFPASAKPWISEKAKFVAQTPGAENTAGFQSSLQQYLLQFPNGDIMGLLMVIFKESIEQTNSDKTYYLKRLSEMSKISQEMGEYLRYLSENISRLEGKRDEDPVCEEGRLEIQKGTARLQALYRRVPSWTPFQLREPRAIGELRETIYAVAADLDRKGAELNQSMEGDLARLETAHARYKELFAKLMDLMGKIPSNRRPDALRLQLVRQYQRVLEELCVQYGLIKGKLLDATRLKAAAAIQKAREFSSAHPGGGGVLNCAVTEVRRLFGNPPANVENVLVCYVLGAALDCEQMERMRRQVQGELYEELLESSEDEVDQCRKELQMMMEMLRKVQDEKERLTELCLGIR